VKLKMKAAALGAALVAATILATPSAAQAGWDACGPDAFCVFQHSDGEGFSIAVAGDGVYQRDLKNLNINDTISSAWNRTGHTVCLFEDADFQGWHMKVPPGAKANFEPGANDKASSVAFCA
jgi:hypothetical protein